MHFVTSYVLSRAISGAAKTAVYGCLGAIALPLALLKRAWSIENRVHRMLAMSAVLSLSYYNRRTLARTGFCLGAGAHILGSMPWRTIIANGALLRRHLHPQIPYRWILSTAVSVISGIHK